VAKFSVDKKDVLILSDDEITRLFVAADALDATGLGRGMGLFVRIGYYMGLRPGENCALRWDNVDFDQKIVRVSHDAETGFRVKMGKERAVKLYPAVAGWMEKHGPVGEYAHGYRNTKDNSFRRHWEKVKSAAGLEGLKPKNLRNNFAFRFLQLTRSEQLTRVMMGHGRETETLVKHYLPQAGMFAKSSLWDQAWIDELKQF
jgi:integrase